MDLRLAPLRTARLRLEPMTADTARAILAGDLSVLAAAGMAAAEQWPHEDTADGLAMAIESGFPPGWLIRADGVVIGDCGIHGPVDAAGCVEIGYGLAGPYRGRGYGTEAVAAITEWLLGLPDVREIRARTLIGNAPSRRVLEKAGFQLAGVDEQEAVYRRASRSG